MAEKKFVRNIPYTSNNRNTFNEFYQWDNENILLKLFDMYIINNLENMLQYDGTRFPHKFLVNFYSNFDELAKDEKKYKNSGIYFSYVANDFERKKFLEKLQEKYSKNSEISFSDTQGNESIVALIIYI